MGIGTPLCVQGGRFLKHVTWLLEFSNWLMLNFANAPGSHRGAEGEMAMTVASPARLAILCGISGTLPVQRWSIELPAITDGEWWRRHSLQSHKGGPETVPFNF